MKFFLTSLAIVIVVAGCASSSKKNNTNNSYSSISLQKPLDQPNQPSKVYIDSVKKVTNNDKQALLIYGTFPDACTNLEEVTHSIENGSLYLKFKAWRNPEMMCAQVLTPFTFVYDKLTEEELTSHSEVIINGTAFSY